MSDNESENIEYGLLVSFTDDSQSFTNGVEAGMLLRDLQASPDELEGTYHAENQELLKRYAEALGYKLKVEIAHAEGVKYEEWIFAQFTKIFKEEKPQPKFDIIDGGLTKHSDNRLKARLGLKKKARQRQAFRALEHGTPREECTGKLRKYLEDRHREHPDKNTHLIVYADHLYIFSDKGKENIKSLVTVFKLPQSLIKGEAQ